MPKYDDKGRLYLRVPWSAVDSVPALFELLSLLSDPGEDGILAWDDSAGDFVFVPAQSANDQVFHGWVDSSAPGSSDLPSGWSCASGATGNFVITHNLDLSTITDLRVVATIIEGEDTSVRATITDITKDAFDVHIDNDAGDSDKDFFFMAILKGS